MLSRISRLLHDDLGLTLSTINILSEVVKYKIFSDQEEAKGYIYLIGEYSQSMIENISVLPGLSLQVGIVLRIY